jgi:hypothetical protein
MPSGRRFQCKSGIMTGKCKQRCAPGQLLIGIQTARGKIFSGTGGGIIPCQRHLGEQQMRVQTHALVARRRPGGCLDGRRSWRRHSGTAGEHAGGNNH